MRNDTKKSWMPTMLVVAVGLLIVSAISLNGSVAHGAWPATPYLTSRTNTADDTTYNLGDVNIPSDGLVIIGVPANVQPTAVSIGGAPAEFNVNHGAGSRWSAIASREVTAGDHNITVSFGSTASRCSAHVFLLPAGSYASATPIDTGAVHMATASSVPIAMDYGSSGLGIYAILYLTPSAVGWSDASEEYDSALESSRTAAAWRIGSGSLTETATPSGGTPNTAMAGAVWAPSVAARHRKYHATNTLQALPPLFASEK
jgi:hypothetical protein